ncbi:MAG: hypothetical protein PHR43_03315 [Dehalococcoidales bacterium]|nr:hypothetical protein [Dehalococcoidales bacterium]
MAFNSAMYFNIIHKQIKVKPPPGSVQLWLWYRAYPTPPSPAKVNYHARLIEAGEGVYKKRGAKPPLLKFLPRSRLLNSGLAILEKLERGIQGVRLAQATTKNEQNLQLSSLQSSIGTPLFMVFLSSAAGILFFIYLVSGKIGAWRTRPYDADTDGLIYV